jgi:hypothetical protein
LRPDSALEQEVYHDGRVGAASDSVEVRTAQATALALLGLEPLPAPAATRQGSTPRLED